MAPVTERLYYNDSNLREFTAVVQRLEPRGELTAVWLDRSALYPTSGGQPFDTGRLDSATVDGVEEDADGDVVHLVRPASTLSLAPGVTVTGTIDWARRLDHMQQHTGQHVLSAILVRLFGVRTVSFHLGAAASTIDLPREMTIEEIAAAEDEANQAVWENRPVSIRYATAEQAAALPLRKESLRSGTLRLIDIEGLDLSACGGTHVGHTGAIGAIVVDRWERFKGGQRLEFLCGGRAIRRFRTLRDVMTAATSRLSVQLEELPPALDRLRAESREQKRSLTTFGLELARYQAEDLVRRAEPCGTVRVVGAAMKGDQETLKAVASAITAQPGLIAILVSDAVPASVVVARSVDVALSCHEVVAALIEEFGGRGGGRPSLAQAGGLEAPAALIIDAVKQAIDARTRGA